MTDKTCKVTYSSNCNTLGIIGEDIQVATDAVKQEIAERPVDLPVPEDFLHENVSVREEAPV